MLDNPKAEIEPPRWRDSGDERAVLDFLKLAWDEEEYKQVELDQKIEAIEPPVIVRINPARRALSEAVKAVGLEGEDYVAVMDFIDGKRNPRPKRKRGRPKQSKNERRERSLLPDAERMCVSAIDFLKSHYPDQKIGPIRDLAIKFTVTRLRWYEVEGLPKQLYASLISRQAQALVQPNIRN